MAFVASRFAVASLAMAVLLGPAYAQKQRGSAAAESGDFEQDGLRFHRANSFIQVVDIAKNQPAGTIIIQPGGALMYAPFPGYDIKAAYEKHMNGGGSQQPSQAAANAPTQPAATSVSDAGATRTDTNKAWDADSKTATLSNGTTVTFTDKDHLQVKEAERTYWVETEKASGFGFAQTVANGQRNRGQSQGTGGIGGMPGSLAGKGIKITTEIETGGRAVKAEVFNSRKGSNRTVAAAQVGLGAVVQDIKDAANIAPVEVRDTDVVKGATSLNVMEGAER